MDMPMIVAFGRYKGRPLHDLLSDSRYCQWLLAQPDILEKHPWIHDALLGAGHLPADTAEHNRLQARFLNKELCIAVGNYPENRLEKLSAYILNELNKDWRSWMRYANSNDWFAIPEFEVDNWDVVIDCHCYLRRRESAAYHLIEAFDFVELKPIISDDYPQILRQVLHRRKKIKASRREEGISSFRREIVIFDEYRGGSVCLSDVQEMFEACDIELVQFSEIVA